MTCTPNKSATREYLLSLIPLEWSASVSRTWAGNESELFLPSRLAWLWEKCGLSEDWGEWKFFGMLIDFKNMDLMGVNTIECLSFIGKLTERSLKTKWISRVFEGIVEDVEVLEICG